MSIRVYDFKNYLEWVVTLDDDRIRRLRQRFGDEDSAENIRAGMIYHIEQGWDIQRMYKFNEWLTEILNSGKIVSVDITQHIYIVEVEEKRSKLGDTIAELKDTIISSLPEEEKARIRDA